MPDAAYQFEWSGGGDDKAHDAFAVNVYQAIIDAVLGEGKWRSPIPLALILQR